MQIAPRDLYPTPARSSIVYFFLGVLACPNPSWWIRQILVTMRTIQLVVDVPPRYVTRLLQANQNRGRYTLEPKKSMWLDAQISNIY